MATKKKAASDAVAFQKRKPEEVPAAPVPPAHAIALVPEGEAWRALPGPGGLAVIMTGPFEDVRIAMIDRAGVTPREADLPRSWYWVEDIAADGARLLLRTARGDGRVYEVETGSGAAAQVWQAPPRASDPGVRLRYAGDRVIALVPPAPHNAWDPGPPPQGALHVLARGDGGFTSIASTPSTAVDFGLVREGAIAVTWVTYPMGMATLVAIDGERFATLPFEQTKKGPVLFADAFIRADRAFVTQGDHTYELVNLDEARARALAT